MSWQATTVMNSDAVAVTGGGSRSLPTNTACPAVLETSALQETCATRSLSVALACTAAAATDTPLESSAAADGERGFSSSGGKSPGSKQRRRMGGSGLCYNARLFFNDAHFFSRGCVSLLLEHNPVSALPPDPAPCHDLLCLRSLCDVPY